MKKFLSTVAALLTICAASAADAPDDGTHFYSCSRPKYCQTRLCRLDATVTANGADIKTAGVEGRTAHEYKIEK